MSTFLSSLYILEISLLSDMGLVKIFSYSVGYHFVLLTVSFALQKLLSFRRSHLLLLSVSVLLVLYLWSCFLYQSVQDYFSLSSMRFSMPGFILRSLIHLDLSFVYGDRYVPISIFYMLTSMYVRTINWRCIILAFFLSKIRYS